MSWKIVTNKTFLNQDKVFPAAQESVLKIVENAKKYEDLKRIIVFGSCIESRFSPMSDIDIYVEQSMPTRYLLAKELIRGVDYWTPFTSNESLLKEIIVKGVVVYER